MSMYLSFDKLTAMIDNLHDIHLTPEKIVGYFILTSSLKLTKIFFRSRDFCVANLAYVANLVYVGV